MKDFIDYDGIHICYISQTFKIYIPPLLVVFRESNEKYLLMCFESS